MQNNDKEFKPHGAVAFLVTMILFYVGFWLVIYRMMMAHAG